MPNRSLTPRGKATRARIVQSAARLVHERGARGTSLDDVMAATGTSKSQVYHYFANKDALLRAVIEEQTARVMAAQAPHLHTLDTLAGLRRWRDALVALNERHAGGSGCPVGSLASELASRSDNAREPLAASFRLWESHLADGLRAMRNRGELSADADPQDLATATVSALQGGLLLAQTFRDARPVRLALDMALGAVERFATAGRPEPRPSRTVVGCSPTRSTP